PVKFVIRPSALMRWNAWQSSLSSTLTARKGILRRFAPSQRQLARLRRAMVQRVNVTKSEYVDNKFERTITGYGSWGRSLFSFAGDASGNGVFIADLQVCLSLR